MTGFSGGIGSPAWFHRLIMLAQKWLPDIKRTNPDDSREWLLAKALSKAFHEEQPKADESGKAPEQAKIGPQS